MIDKNMIENTESDLLRARLVLFSNENDEKKSEFFKYIKTPYYRIQLVKNTTNGSQQYTLEELFENMKNYESIKDKLISMDSEAEKTSFILSLDDWDMRVCFLNQIRKTENRDKIILSMQGKIDEEIKPQVDLAQRMIREFFQDTLGEEFDENKREKLEIALNRTSIGCTKFSGKLNGKSEYIFNKIEINEKYRKNVNLLIGILCHEYGHQLSNFDFKTTRKMIGANIEEGVQDVFAEQVINHYMRKHGQVMIDGKKVRINYPYNVYSGYDYENAWARTLLYPLEDRGIDLKVLAEYQIGSKAKALGMILGREYQKNAKVDEFGVPIDNIDLNMLYNSNKDSFKNVNRNSIYYKRNAIIPGFEIQSRLDKFNISILNGRTERIDYIAGYYFCERRIFDISPEEMQEFFELIHKSDGLFVYGYSDFANGMIEDISYDDNREEIIKKYSFQILETSIPLLQSEKKINDDVAEVLEQCLEREEELLREGQTVDVSMNKYRRFIPKMIQILSNSNSNNNLLLVDKIKGLQEYYLEQMKQAIDENLLEEVIAGLTDSKTGYVFVDKNITQILNEKQVRINTIRFNNKTYKIEDVLDSADRVGVKLEDIEAVSSLVDIEMLGIQELEEEKDENNK